MFLSAFNASASDEALDLQCVAVPHANNYLCTGQTEGFEPMYRDLLLFEKTAHGSLRFLSVEESTVVGEAAFWGFSDDGHNLVIETSEEGHASYLIYDTMAFIAYPTSATGIASVSDYSLPLLEAIDDDANAVFEHMDKPEGVHDMACLNDIGQYGYPSGEGVCLVRVNLHGYAVTASE